MPFDVLQHRQRRFIQPAKSKSLSRVGAAPNCGSLSNSVVKPTKVFVAASSPPCWGCRPSQAQGGMQGEGSAGSPSFPGWQFPSSLSHSRASPACEDLPAVYAQSSSAPSNFLTADNQQSWANNLARIIYSMNFDSLPTSSLCCSPRCWCCGITQGSCCLGPGLVASRTPGARHGLVLRQVAFVLLVAWDESDLR